MKTLSIKQPWGSIICSGLKHVENRTWALKKLPQRILIHVGASKITKYDGYSYLPEEWVSLMFNARTMGLLPQEDETPYSAIIGWADIVRCDEPGNNNSDIWAINESVGWVLENVHVFDEPIMNVKGKLGLFEYPMDENNMPPSHPAVFKDPEVVNDCVIMPVCDKLWAAIQDGEGTGIEYCLTDENFDLFADQEGNLKPFKMITFTNHGKSMSYELTSDSNTFAREDENGEPYTFTSLSGETCTWLYVYFALGKRI